MKQYVILVSMITFVTGCQPGTGESLPAEEINQPPPTQSSDLLSDIQQQIFTPICTECHIGSQAPLGLRLESTELAYQFLVDVDAVGNSAFKRVTANDSNNSFLFLKVSGDPQAGQRMPLGKAPLTNQQIQLIRDWIDQGALPATGTNLLSKISSVEKIQLDQQPNQDSNFSNYTIRFSQPIETKNISPQNIQLVDQIDGQDFLISYENYQLSAIDNRTLKLDIDAKYSSHRITLVIDSSNAQPIIDTAGRMIDADHDHIEGGRFEFKL